jgi:phage terminase large subunit-like protein
VGRASRKQPAGALEVADAYAKAVLDGSQPANRRLKTFCAQYRAARERGTWDAERLDRLVAYARDRFKWELMPWAVLAMAHLVAWRSETDEPAVRVMVIQVARGAGKTSMAGILSAWTLEEAARAGRKSEVVVLATQMEKAALVQKLIKDTIGSDDELWEFYGGNMSTVGALCKHPGGEVKCRPSTVKNADGITPTLLVCDEAARMDETFSRALSSMSKVRGSQMLVVTTPDAEQFQNPYGSIIRQLEKAYDSGERPTDGLCGMIFGIDPDDRPDSADAWAKAHPGLGVHTTVAQYEFQKRTLLDSGNPRDREEFYTQQLATFTDDLSGALPLALFDACVSEWDLAAARGLPGVIGIDFSQGGWATGSQCDLTSLNLSVWDGQNLLSRSWHYWAGNDIAADEQRSHQPLREWRDSNRLTVFGNTVDYSVIERQLEVLANLVSLKHFVADPAGKAAAWCESMERKHGWSWSRAPQNGVFMGSAWAIWADMVRGKQIRFAPDPVLRANLAHCRLRPGDTGLHVPSKGRSASNIDAVTACCMAVKVMQDREMLQQTMYTADPLKIAF